MSPSVIDKQNTEFWNELSGTSMARSLGITEPSPENLRRFDEAYLRFYPYLAKYVYPEDLKGKQVLEIGLGYGTLGQVLALQGCRYYGLDIAVNPVTMMRYRFSLLGLEGSQRVQVGSALDIPYKEATFDYVYSIGCLHHTGDLGRGVEEVHRVLKGGGKAVIMLYHRHSYRMLVHLPLLRLRNWLRQCFRPADGSSGFSQWVRAFYDHNSKGEAAPHIDYVSRAQARRLFGGFRDVRVESQNFDTLMYKGEVLIPREFLLSNLGRIMGVDLYVTATK